MMKKIFAFAVCLLAIVACKQGNSEKQTDDLNDRIDSLTRVNVQKDNEINDMLETFNTIEEGFRAINEAQGRVTVERRGEGANSAERIKEDMKFISEKMTENKELINKLRLRLRDSNTASEQLKKTLANLTAQLETKEKELAELREELDAKDVRIGQLDEQVANLNDNVASLQEESTQKTETINAQEKQLNAAWYVFGTKKELKEQNILKNGEVLQGNFNKNYFTKIDIRVDKEIKLMSRDAKLLTNHPAGSYTLERDANKQYVLRITNPQSFWSTSKYLVVLVK